MLSLRFVTPVHDLNWILNYVITWSISLTQKACEERGRLLTNAALNSCWLVVCYCCCSSRITVGNIRKIYFKIHKSTLFDTLVPYLTFPNDYSFHKRIVKAYRIHCLHNAHNCVRNLWEAKYNIFWLIISLQIHTFSSKNSHVYGTDLTYLPKCSSAMKTLGKQFTCYYTKENID